MTIYGLVLTVIGVVVKTGVIHASATLLTGHWLGMLTFGTPGSCCGAFSSLSLYGADDTATAIPGQPCA